MSRETRKLLSTCITAITNFSTMYNYQCVSVALILMSAVECTTDDGHCKQGKQAAWVQSTSTAGIFLGSIVGQLGLGFLGDYFSRSTALIWTMCIALISSIITSAASLGSANSTYAIIIFFRFVLGIGLGGVFPLSASKASEDAGASGRVNSYAAAKSHFWQIFAFFVPWLLCYIFTFTTLSTDTQWRLILGVGAIPSFISIVLLFVEINVFGEQAVDRDLESIERDGTTTDSAKHTVAETTTTNTVAVKIPPKKVTLDEIWTMITTDRAIQRKLIASGFTWFVYDIIVFGITLMSGNIVSDIYLDDDNITTNENIRRIAEGQMIVTGLTVVCNVCGVLLVPIIGLKALQILDFLIIATFAALVSACFSYLSHHDTTALFALYCLLYPLQNLGLGSTSYSLPAALFKYEIRATFNGICAAWGKLGAALGCFTFPYIAMSGGGYTTVLAICSFLALLGAYVTFITIDNRELLNGDAKFKRGWIHTKNPNEDNEKNIVNAMHVNMTPVPSMSEKASPMAKESVSVSRSGSEAVKPSEVSRKPSEMTKTTSIQNGFDGL